MRKARLAWVVVIGAALSGCAGAGASMHRSQRDANDDFDAGKVATVTQWAQARGATVVWMHYPTKRRSGDEGG